MNPRFRPHVLGIDGLAVGHFDEMDGGGCVLRDHMHALREKAIDATDGLIARFQRVQHGCFNAARARSRKREGDAILGLENLAEEDLGLVHAFPEPGIKVAGNG